MNARRQLLSWLLAALAGLLFLIGILIWEHRRVQERSDNFLVGNPRAGAQTFQEKGCVGCHAICGAGTQVAPDLGIQRTPGSSMNQLATQMWNHAPLMWAKMEERKTRYPVFTGEEMANLFAYLYSSCYAEESGDPARGERLFSQKSCIRCHSTDGTGGKEGPALRNLGPVDTPIFWAQRMWNHASAMERHMRQFNISWPRFDGDEMDDLLAYVRKERAGPRREFDLLPADPARGWALFQKKGCMACHAVRGQGGTMGPDLGAGRPLPPTLTQLAGQMWNHSPEMWAAMKAKGVERPTFEGREMADVFAFLYSLRYFELGGSPLVGKELFNARNCGRCHGADGRGGEFGPAVRQRGKLLTPVSLAQALWSHGPQMYRKSKQLGLPWPTLKGSDLDHLLAFLNSTPEDGH